MMSRLRVLFAPLGHILAHRSRCLAVAEEMRDRGHAVGFLCVPGEEALIAARGLEPLPVYHMPASALRAFGVPMAYQLRVQAEGHALPESGSFGVAQMAADDLAAYETFSPDVVVWDGRPTTPLTASLQGIVAIGINNLSMPVSDEEAPDSLRARFRTEFAEHMLPMVGASAQHARLQRHLSWIVPGLPATENAAKLGLLGNPVHVHIGALHWRGWDELPVPTALTPGRPRILLTLGSTFPFPQQALALASALADEGYEAVVNMHDLEADAVLQPGVLVQPRLNLRRYLQTCVAVVHHGGHGTAVEALRAGVPALMLPFNEDQMDIARRLSGLGCGLSLPSYPGDLNIIEARDALRRLVAEPEFKAQAVRFQNELTRLPEGAVLAADFIERRVPQVRRVLA